MKGKGPYTPRITAMQLSLALIASRASVMAVFLPVIWAKGDPKNGWVISILSGVGGMLLIWMSVKLSEMHPNKTLIEITQSLLGKWVGGVVSVIFLWFFLHIATIMTRQFAEILNVALMPETPIQVFIICITLAVIFAVSRGLEAIAKVTALTTPLSILSLFLIVLFNKKNYEISALLPVLENGWSGVLYGSIVPLAWFGDVFLIMMLFPYVKDKPKVKPYTLLSIVVTTILLVLLSGGVIGVFGPEEAGQLTLPLFSFVRMIEVASFFERIEAVLVAIWISIIFSKICFYLYIGIQGTGQLFKLQAKRFLIIPMGICPIVLAKLSFKNLADLKYFLTPGYFGIYALSIEIIFPLLLLLITLLKPKERAAS
ncbi:GerAB/ArcD/ProY family transporter [Brevibacillus ginsengisoli]|uniref:GerAB/ArcD/ProY family transporter n=1 Tax=Brevibacillus ginsengisoli TaxID=363854 RepID=UPI003CE7E04E